MLTNMRDNAIIDCKYVRPVNDSYKSQIERINPTKGIKIFPGGTKIRFFLFLIRRIEARHEIIYGTK